MQSEDIAVKFEGYGKEIGSLKHRMDACEKMQSEITALVRSVDRLAINMENMLTEQKGQGERLARLEQAPAEDYRHYKRVIIGCIITGVIGILLGAVITLILK